MESERDTERNISIPEKNSRMAVVNLLEATERTSVADVRNSCLRFTNAATPVDEKSETPKLKIPHHANVSILQN